MTILWGSITHLHRLCVQDTIGSESDRRQEDARGAVGSNAFHLTGTAWSVVDVFFLYTLACRACPVYTDQGMRSAGQADKDTGQVSTRALSRRSQFPGPAVYGQVCLLACKLLSPVQRREEPRNKNNRNNSTKERLI